MAGTPEHMKRIAAPVPGLPENNVMCIHHEPSKSNTFGVEANGAGA